MPKLAYQIAPSPPPRSVSPRTTQTSIAQGPVTQPFRDAEEAWMWTMAALTARREGARFTANKGKMSRPCEPDDVIRCLDALYRQRRVALTHARILRIWGERQAPPNPGYATERADWQLWREALERLEWPLRMKGIVA